MKPPEDQDTTSEVNHSSSASQTGSKLSSTSSARARASAKRAALEAKLKGMTKWQELEERRHQIEMNIERMKVEVELDAAAAEEQVLRSCEDGGPDVR